MGPKLTIGGDVGGPGFLVTQGVSSVVDASPLFNTADGPLVTDAVIVIDDDTILYDVAMESSHPANGRPFLQIRIHKENSPRGGPECHGREWPSHAWNHTHLSNDVGNWGQNFQAAQPGWLWRSRIRHSATRLRTQCDCIRLNLPTLRALKSVEVWPFPPTVRHWTKGCPTSPRPE